MMMKSSLKNSGALYFTPSLIDKFVQIGDRGKYYRDTENQYICRSCRKLAITESAL